jgi:hypothetical protein
MIVNMKNLMTMAARNYNIPLEAMDTGGPSPTTKWSNNRISKSSNASFKRRVMAWSARLGSLMPEG